MAVAVSVGVWATVALGGSIGWKLEGRPVLRPPSRARLPAVRLAKVRAPPFLSSLAACPLTVRLPRFPGRTGPETGTTRQGNAPPL